MFELRFCFRSRVGKGSFLSPHFTLRSSTFFPSTLRRKLHLFFIFLYLGLERRLLSRMNRAVIPRNPTARRRSARLAKQASPSASLPALLRLPPELLEEIALYIPECRRILMRTCNRLCDVYSRVYYRELKIFCGGIHFTAEDIKRVSMIFSALLSSFTFGQHVDFLALFDFRSGIRTPFFSLPTI